MENDGEFRVEGVGWLCKKQHNVCVLLTLRKLQAKGALEKSDLIWHSFPDPGWCHMGAVFSLLNSDFLKKKNSS